MPPMLLYWAFFIIGILAVSYRANETKIEWSLGSNYPVAKVLDSGTIQDLYCSVNADDDKYPIILLCPLNIGICLPGCNSTKYISCSKMFSQGKLIYQYKFKIFKNFEGPWKCQYGKRTSRTLHLSVSDKPYIKSLTMNPDPAWKGSLLNITCEIMPMEGITSIQFQRLLEDNSTVSINDVVNYKNNRWSTGIIITSATPGTDDRIQCTVYSANGIITTKVLKTNIFYFPKSLNLTSTATQKKRHEVGSVISFMCSSDGGNPYPVLNIFHERVGETPKKMLDHNLVLTKQDNNAIFYCEIEKLAGRTSFIKSNTIKIIVNYPPEKIELTEEPEDQLMESQIKQLVCLSRSNSEPPSYIDWSMNDSLGKKVQRSEINKILETDPSELEQVNTILKSTVKMVMLRIYNGYTITCSIYYQDKELLTQTKTIKVVFAPNNVALNSNPLGPIPEGESVVLTCSTGSANPPSKIQWFKTEPGKRTKDITTHSNIDMAPGNFSGVAISSALNIHGASRSSHGTLYKCVVSHAYLNAEISKEYFLNVLFPPVIQVTSFPKQIEEGDKVHLQCQTTGGNPGSIFQYNFQWNFCPVNASYQPPLNSDSFNKPSSEMRNSCSQLSENFKFHQNPVLNISSITSKDRGWYSCHIRSPGGKASGYIFLDVLYPPVLTYQTPSRIYAKLGSNIILNAELASNPTNVDIKWYFRQSFKASAKAAYDQDHASIQSMPGVKQRLLMKPFGRIKYSLMENFTIHFTLTSLLATDYGDYFCEVRNRLGKRTLEFQVCPSDDISISESKIRLQFNGRRATVFYDPPSVGHFTHLVLRTCPIQDVEKCKDMQISNPLSGQAAIMLAKSANMYSYRLLVFNGSTLLQITNAIHSDIKTSQWVEMSIEMLIAVIIGVAGILVLLFVALLTLILLKYRRRKPKGNYMEQNSEGTMMSHQRRQDYMLLNSPQNTNLLKNSCHCFSNYPIELRSDNGSDHSVPSQNVYQPMLMRRKMRDNGELSSVHSGGSCHSPDVVLTEKTSINSSNNPMINGTLYPYPHGNGSTKVTLLSGRLQTLDGQRQDASMVEDFMIPQEMIFAAVDDDRINLSQARLIPIPKNLPMDYPIYLQMNNPMVPKPYEMNPPPLYASPMPSCQNRLECNNQDSRENSSMTNTDSNQDSGNHDPATSDATGNTIDNMRNNI